jgi:hypothetical protein
MKLEIGYKSSFELRKEIILLENSSSFSVLYLSDLHLNRFSQRLIQQVIDCIETQNPNIILLGGDYVDTHRGFFYFEQLLEKISQRQHVFAIAGNHDYFYSISKIKSVCEKFNVIWIENSYSVLTINNLTIKIVGTKLQANLPSSDFSILCLHEPIDIQPFHTAYDLVLAGHLHGCQFIFWENEKGLFPGKLFYRWNILKTQIGSCLYLVSKGLGDTLPIRWNCKRDIILVEVKASF